MAEKKTTPVVIDNVEYALEDMTVEQQTLVSHVHDLDRKLKSAQFNTEQLLGGREFFIARLAASLKEPEKTEES